ncbi:MAG: sporulation protein YunB, partial [Ruminococcus sp.]|nr:sporulation protein YunB [Ruminococcus sp.]
GFNVPIGTLSGITFLAGRGFDLELKLHQLGSVSTRIRSEFDDCGINQSRYRVYINISVELSAVLPIRTTEITVESQYLLAEKVIVGDVPDAYFSA